MFVRLLIFFLIISLLISWSRRALIRRLEKHARPQTLRRTTKQPLAEILVACAHCGAFFRKEQGVEKKGKWYCGKDCAVI